MAQEEYISSRPPMEDKSSDGHGRMARYNEEQLDENLFPGRMTSQTWDHDVNDRVARTEAVGACCTYVD